MSIISNVQKNDQTKPFVGRNKGLFGNQTAKAISQAGREAKRGVKKQKSMQIL